MWRQTSFPEVGCILGIGGCTQQWWRRSSTALAERWPTCLPRVTAHCPPYYSKGRDLHKSGSLVGCRLRANNAPAHHAHLQTPHSQGQKNSASSFCSLLAEVKWVQPQKWKLHRLLGCSLPHQQQSSYAHQHWLRGCGTKPQVFLPLPVSCPSGKG